MRSTLLKSGFESVDMYDWRDLLPENYDDYSKAYLPHMDVKNGKLMSLNMMARKPISK